jgi:hypothetical protein
MGKSQVRGLSSVVLTEIMHDLQDPLRGLTHPGACPTEYVLRLNRMFIPCHDTQLNF